MQFANWAVGHGFALASLSYRLATPLEEFSPEDQDLITRRQARSQNVGLTLSPALCGSFLEAARRDIGMAIARLRAHHVDWGVASASIGLIGLSAGGIAGLSLIYPPDDMPAENRPDALLGIATAMVQPWCLSAGQAPALLIHGPTDRIIPPDDLRLLQNRVERTGANIDVVFSDRTGHNTQVDAFFEDADDKGAALSNRALSMFETALL